MLGLIIGLVVGFFAGILVGRKNKSTIETVVDSAKKIKNSQFT